MRSISTSTVAFSVWSLIKRLPMLWFAMLTITVLWGDVGLAKDTNTYMGMKGWYMWTPGDTVDHPGYRPEQPIPFSHKTHAGDRGIPCEYCHAAARRSLSAGIPPMNTCMGCHRFVGTDLEPIKWMTEKYQNNEPIEWIKVHDLPDFVRFSHQIHVGAGLECQECHGEVQMMEVVEQVGALQMSWCLECHREKGASDECLTCHF